MNRLLKKIIAIFIIILFIAAFSSSYSTHNIDNLAVIVALGIDTSEINKVKVTFQFTNASSVSESGTTEKAPSIINTIDASSITSAFNMMNSYIGKELILSHCKIVVFSEEIAKQGISDEIYTLINDAQIRPSANIVVSKCDAKYYIDNSKPIFEPLITKYYEVFPNSSKYTGYTANATIGDFFDDMICTSCEPFAILGGINSENSQNNTTVDSQKDSNTKSNESTLSGALGAENIGLAVFKGGSLAGELNAIETLCFLNTKNQLEEFMVSIPNPKVENSYIDIYLTPSKKTSVSINTSNGSPYVKLNYTFSGKISSMTQNANYLDNSSLEEISNSCNSYLESIFSNYFYKTSLELKSDINGIGNFERKNFLTQNDYRNFNWEQNYKNCAFNISVNTNLNSGFLLNETQN